MLTAPVMSVTTVESDPIQDENRSDELELKPFDANLSQTDLYLYYYQLFSDYLLEILNNQYNCTNSTNSMINCFAENLNDTSTLYINMTDMRSLLTPMYHSEEANEDEQNEDDENDEYIKQFIQSYRYNYCRVFYDGIFCKEYFINYDNEDTDGDSTTSTTKMFDSDDK
jgi:hypothetical protein